MSLKIGLIGLFYEPLSGKSQESAATVHEDTFHLLGKSAFSARSLQAAKIAKVFAPGLPIHHFTARQDHCQPHRMCRLMQ